jgi:hypothetical protein
MAYTSLIEDSTGESRVNKPLLNEFMCSNQHVQDFANVLAEALTKAQEIEQTVYMFIPDGTKAWIWVQEDTEGETPSDMLAVHPNGMLEPMRNDP